MDDSISRSDAIKMIQGINIQSGSLKALLLFRTKELPSTQRTGHWQKFAMYKNDQNQDRASMFCSECETFFDGYPEIKEWNYCPECGARMDGDGNE